MLQRIRERISKRLSPHIETRIHIHNAQDGSSRANKNKANSTKLGINELLLKLLREDCPRTAPDAEGVMSPYISSKQEASSNHDSRWGRWDLNPGPPAPQAFKASTLSSTTYFSVGETDTFKLLESFVEFCAVDLHLASGTVKNHVYNVKEFLSFVHKPLGDVCVEDVRVFLKRYVGANSYTYANKLKSLRRFLGDFLGYGWIRNFKIPKGQFRPKILPDKSGLRRFFECLRGDMYKALFLVLASSGLRLGEVLSLSWGDVDLERGLVLPKPHMGVSKRCWVSCINSEAVEALRVWRLNSKHDAIFPVKKDRVAKVFRKASIESGVKITAKTLREWFCSEMARLGVPDRYIDALCGRMPRSILARHYTDYSPDRLREVYAKAGLTVLK